MGGRLPSGVLLGAFVERLEGAAAAVRGEGGPDGDDGGEPAEPEGE
jgi:hypothetical protein